MSDLILLLVLLITRTLFLVDLKAVDLWYIGVWQRRWY
jgi:hypothetical protein